MPAATAATVRRYAASSRRLKPCDSSRRAAPATLPTTCDVSITPSGNRRSRNASRPKAAGVEPETSRTTPARNVSPASTRGNSRSAMLASVGAVQEGAQACTRQAELRRPRAPPAPPTAAAGSTPPGRRPSAGSTCPEPRNGLSSNTISPSKTPTPPGTWLARLEHLRREKRAQDREKRRVGSAGGGHTARRPPAPTRPTRPQAAGAPPRAEGSGNSKRLESQRCAASAGSRDIAQAEAPASAQPAGARQASLGSQGPARRRSGSIARIEPAKQRTARART